jgi:hypothetical protein
MNIIRNPIQRVYRAGQAIFWPRKKQTITPPVQLIYSYVTPPTAVAPVAGEIVHGTNVINKLNVSHLDLNGIDVSASIGQITTGDRISVGSTVYDVVAPTVAGAGFSYITVEPAVQKQPGVYPVKAWR